MVLNSGIAKPIDFKHHNLEPSITIPSFHSFSRSYNDIVSAKPSTTPVRTTTARISSHGDSIVYFLSLMNLRSDRKLFTKLADIYYIHPMLVDTVGKTTNNSIVLYLITVVI